MQQEEGLGNGISSPVKISVQELVRSDAKNVPERYIRNPDNRPKSSEIRLVSDDDVPVIDFSLLARGDEDERKKLDVACQEWGFFQIINHGAEEAIPKMKAAVIDFYDLPLSEKNKYAMPPDYFEGYSQDNKVGERKRDWYDILWLLTMPPHSRNTKYWPLTSWSNGKYKGLEHRVVANVEKPRISVISFVIPSDEAELNPLKTMVDDDHPPIYKNGVKYIDYLLYANTKETEEDKYVNNIEYLKREI
ncbi:putative 2-oxoglutarate-dependent dioxygenase ANS [Sesamum angolense]|uniref:2-oxoglutarate-dependent dioxygenase ANS n=1 Tax=Sesamum angolense TaxID=2727404 RepID=A0AAE1W289_9LAMI|nr:putative 2-oxoglutarate-dependent dioxygenase ANS [Sesamum angolense]